MGARKFKSEKHVDNVETKKLLPIIQEFLESIELPFDEHLLQIEPLEFRSRDGFSAHDHNRGGMDLFSTSDVAGLMGSGYHLGTQIENHVESEWDRAREEVAKSHPELDTEGEEFYDKIYEYHSDDYSGIAYRVRVMYEGDGVLMVYGGYDTDAPYFRWNDKANFEKQITFKNRTELKKKLKALVKKVQKAQ